MKKLFLVSTSLLVGILIGWYFGYTRPILKAEREFSKKVKMPPVEIRELIQKCREQVNLIDGNNHSAALASLIIFLKLEAGDTDAAEDKAIHTIARYYNEYGPADVTKTNQSERQRRLLDKIEEVAELYPQLKSTLKSSAEQSALPLPRAQDGHSEGER